MSDLYYPLLERVHIVKFCQRRFSHMRIISCIVVKQVGHTWFSGGSFVVFTFSLSQGDMKRRWSND